MTKPDPLTAEDVAHLLADARENSKPIAHLITEDERNKLFRILHNEHAVYDRATHRAVSVELLSYCLHALEIVEHGRRCHLRTGDQPERCTCGLTDTIEEVQELLK